MSFASAQTEFRVNTTTSGDQSDSSVASDPNGNSVVVWQSSQPAGSADSASSWDIYGRRYDAQGRALGPEFRVNSTTSGEQTEPSVAMGHDGSFIVVWYSFFNDPSDDIDFPGIAGAGVGVERTIFARRFSKEGIAQGAELKVAEPQPGWSTAQGYRSMEPGRPQVAIDAQGGFVVAWETHERTTRPVYCFARLMCGYLDELPEVRFRRYTGVFDSIGLPESKVTNPVPEALQFCACQVEPSVAMEPGGTFVIVWGDWFGDTHGRRFTSKGIPDGPAFRVNSSTDGTNMDPSVGMDDKGNFLVAWTGLHSSGNWGDVYGKRFSKNGSVLGAEFQVNDHTFTYQNSPSVAVDADGDSVIVWRTADPWHNWADAPGHGVFSQRYDKTGAARGGDSQISSEGVQSQAEPSAAMDALGNYMVTWQTTGQDGDGKGIYGRRFVANP